MAQVTVLVHLVYATFGAMTFVLGGIVLASAGPAVSTGPLVDGERVMDRRVLHLADQLISD